MAAIVELTGRTLVLVAHPDDETIGCGGLLQRMTEPIVVFATDGAPRDQYFWSKYGSRLRYQRLREEEGRQALATAGISEIEFVGAPPLSSGEGIVDQELYVNLAEARDRIAAVVNRRRPKAILTLAYEGGHPDHDCCSMLATHLGGQYGVPVWEFPLYHRGPAEEVVFQQFVARIDSEILLELTAVELANKQAMVQAYASQHPFLMEFDLRIERVRPQAAYDYSRPPHPGKLNYEAWGWRITGAHVCAAHRIFAASRAAVS